MQKAPLTHGQAYLDVTRSLFFHLLVPGRVDGWARKVRAPVTILQGAHDRIVPPVCSEELARRHGFEIELLEGAGHVPQMEDAARFTERVAAWLRRHGLAAEPAAAPRSLRPVPAAAALEGAPPSLRAVPAAAALEAAPPSLRPVPSANDGAPLTVRSVPSTHDEPPVSRAA